MLKLLVSDEVNAKGGQYLSENDPDFIIKKYLNYLNFIK